MSVTTASTPCATERLGGEHDTVRLGGHRGQAALCVRVLHRTACQHEQHGEHRDLGLHLQQHAQRGRVGPVGVVHGEHQGRLLGEAGDEPLAPVVDALRQLRAGCEQRSGEPSGARQRPRTASRLDRRTEQPAQHLERRRGLEVPGACQEDARPVLPSDSDGVLDQRALAEPGPRFDHDRRAPPTIERDDSVVDGRELRRPFVEPVPHGSPPGDASFDGGTPSPGVALGFSRGNA